MTSQDAALLNLANRSGFPLQIGLANRINTTHNTTHCEVIAEEHYWETKEPDRSGFIDLAVFKPSAGTIFVTECKKSQAGASSPWIFLVARKPTSSVQAQNTNATRLVRTWDPVKYCDWVDELTLPHSYKSQFFVPREKCTMRQLEVPASETAMSAMGFALQYCMHTDEMMRYVPVVVTNSPLTACLLDSDSIDLSSGEIDGSGGRGTAPIFEDVPWIRFHKQLAAGATKKRTFQESANANDRTVFVVNADRFVEFIAEWRVI